jgi:hypothetical protein
MVEYEHEEIIFDAKDIQKKIKKGGKFVKVIYTKTADDPKNGAHVMVVKEVNSQPNKETDADSVSPAQSKQDEKK